MDRTGRVRILKRVIVFTIITLIIVPTCLSIVSLVELSDTKEEIASLNEETEMLRNEILDLEQDLVLKDKQFSDALKSSENALKESEILKKQLNELSAEKEEKIKPQKVYLTFDDGPSGHTQDILDILDEYDVKATFFVCATRNSDYEAFYKKILDKGHTLGLHSYSHVYNEIYASSDAFYEDVSSIMDYVSERTGGYIAKFYRFPGGSTNENMVLDLEDYISELDSLGLTFFDWNISIKDATNPMQSKEVLFKNATLKAQDYDEVMILMHDLGNKDSTVEVLPEIIEYYKELGSTFCAIDETTVPIRQNK